MGGSWEGYGVVLRQASGHWLISEYYEAKLVYNNQGHC